MAVTAPETIEAQLDRLSLVARAGLVDKALGGNGWTPLTWEPVRLHRTSGTTTSGVFRIGGTAVAAGVQRTWSLILKVVSPAAWLAMTTGQPAEPSHPLFWQREVLAYQSGWLDNLPGNVRGPRCLAVETQPDGSVWLWLEEAQDCYGGRWPLEQYARAARCLGRFNGAYLANTPWPSYPWLSQTGTPRGVIEAYRWLEPLVRDPATWAHPGLQAAFRPALVARLPELWDWRHVLLDALERLPQTVCHQDAWRGNAFSPSGSADELVLIDWAYVGAAAVGSDLSDLAVAGYPLLPADVTPLPAEIDAAVFDAYLSGLREAGWVAPRNPVRFAYCTHAALKYGCLLIWLRDFGDANQQAGWERFSGQPLDTWLGQQALVLEHQLNLFDEALSLLPRL